MRLFGYGLRVGTTVTRGGVAVVVSIPVAVTAEVGLGSKVSVTMRCGGWMPGVNVGRTT